MMNPPPTAPSIADAMTQTFQQLPRPPKHKVEKSNSDGLIALSLLFLFALFPRLWILGFWIFGRQLGNAFDGWIVPALGFLFLPWTTLLYAWMWAIGSDGLHGWEWLPVGFSLLIDVWFWVAGPRSLRD
jgi:hypothetical protein